MKSKLKSILLSVGLALLLWLYVITVVSPGSKDTFYDIPVVLEGAGILEERGLMVTDVETDSVTLELSGNRVDLNQLDNSNIIIRANLASVYDPGEDIQLSYTITYPGTVANNAFTEESRSPAFITVTVEKIAYRDVPVRVVYTGSVGSDYIAKTDEEFLDYEEIRISGPVSVVEKITQARIEVDLDGQTESINQSYRYTLCDEQGEPVNSELITVNAKEVHLQLPILQLKTVPLVVTVVDGGGATKATSDIKIQPQTIQVCGSAAVLEDLDEIVLGTIYLEDYLAAAELTFEIKMPTGVTNLSNRTEAVVNLSFPNLTTKELILRDMEIINVPAGMEVDLINEVMTITVRGSSAEIASITAADVRVTIDFDGAVPGTSYWRVTIHIDDSYKTVGAVGSYQVPATIREVQTQAAEE